MIGCISKGSVFDEAQYKCKAFNIGLDDFISGIIFIGYLICERSIKSDG